MRIPKRRCAQCHRWFQPIRSNQKTCTRKKCQKQRHRKNREVWRKENPGRHCSSVQVRIWAEREKYWQGYRRDNPDYREREKQRMRLKRKKDKSVAKGDLRKKISVERLRSIQQKGSEAVAKGDSSDRRVDEILGYLLWKETSQKETQAQSSKV